LTAKRAKDLLDVLEDTKEAMFKDRKTDYPYTQWEHKRTQIKERLTKLPQYIHQAIQTIAIEEQKCGPEPKLNLEKKSTSS